MKIKNNNTLLKYLFESFISKNNTIEYLKDKISDDNLDLLIKSFLKDDICVYASHPTNNLVYIHTIKNISKYFKKIYFIYSSTIFNESNFLNLLEKNNDNIEIIYIENIGYDFNKYFTGIKKIKENNEKFNKLWLINDSFLINDWRKNFFTFKNLNIIYKNDLIGTFEGYHKKIKHLQSFLLIMNTEISEFYFKELFKSDFLNYNIKNKNDKMNYILELEVKLCNKLIKSGKYKINSLYNFCYPSDINKKILSLNYHKNIKFNDGYHNNQAFWIGPLNNIFKVGYIYNSLTSNLILKKNLEINKFHVNLDIYFHLYEPFVKYYNFFYNKKIFFKNLDNIKNFNNYFRIDNLTLIDSVFSILPFFDNINYKISYKNLQKMKGNIIKFLSNKINVQVKDIIDSLSLINYLKKYKFEYENNENSNKLLINLGDYFYKNGNKTNIEKLKEDIQNYQKKTGNKKLVYTNNLNSYDTFWDIDNNLVDTDTDYLYISNVYDENVCNNFKFIYCNLESDDCFYNNRLIKFNKQLFDCYDKVLYIDSNVKINKKLSTYFNLLTSEVDLVLYSHPERKFLEQEINEVKLLNNPNWKINENDIINFKNEYNSSMKNDLYGLNIILSNTKYNIFEDINTLYQKYNFKRDQIYFSCIQLKYKIIKINILNKFKLNNDFDILDGDYEYIEGLTEYFSRPFGGLHI